MIQRYAAHFVFLPEHGWLRQYVVEVEDGVAISLFPLTEEIEGVAWHPGVIALLRKDVESTPNAFHSILRREEYEFLNELPQAFLKEQFPCGLMPYWFYPFDFTTMQPADGTRHRLLL